MTGHDQLFKDLFREFFPELLHLADADLAARLTAGSRGFAFLDKEVFLDWPEGRRREADLVAEVSGRRGKRKLLIDVEIEHQHRRTIGRRLWRYSNQLDLRYGVPVVTIVVFLRGGPPGTQWIDHIEQVTGRTIHRFTYLSLGLSGIQAETLLERSEPLAWALAALARRPGKMGRARLKLNLLRKIATASVNELQRYLLTNCVETYLQLTGRVAEQYAALYAAQTNPEIEAMRLTWADRMEIEYEQRGIEKGLEKGVVRLRQSLLRLLGKRFGEVSPAVRERVEAISSIEELGGLVDRILEVKSIEELGLDR
ncbi:MAG TPA: DUF4351 domain-containing protein [Thermoanaerobaculia bacterium]|jgi:hypothetical protein|nr:DUF4351 domain-containing protein [Thermoanaerobaculia bacterium]